MNIALPSMRIVLILLIAVVSALNVSAQTNEEELAAQYYAEGEYDKAAILYKKLYKKNHESVYIYQNYLNSLTKLKRFDEAEKMVEKAIKKHPENQVHYVDLGHIFVLQDQKKKADQLYDRKLKALPPNPNSIEQLARAFLKYDLYERAEQTYMIGRQLIGMSTAFHEDVVQLYLRQRKYQNVIDECLGFLYVQPKELALIKSDLTPILAYPEQVNYLQERTLMYIQKNANSSSFDDLLMWVMIQQKKFRSAFRQAVAMDKRQKGEGKVIMDLADICMKNGAYEVAEKCYANIVERGEENLYFLNAKMGQLESSYARIKQMPNYSQAQVDDLLAKYNSFLNDFGRGWNTASSMKEMADVYIFYKHNLDQGMLILEELIKMPRLRPQMKAEYKLALADAYVMKNEVWEATLLYGQVDKEFKEDPLGQEAKFRNARLSYFRGDFEWSKDQLEVLQTATSQLISNNAIELALLIQDNTGLDSTTDALEAFANAQLLLFQNKLDDCLKALNLLPFKFPNHSLEDEIYFTKAQVMEKKQDYVKAEAFYASVVELFPGDILADNALYALGSLYEHKLQQPDKAVESYEKLIFNYSGSLFVVDARKHYKRLKAEIVEEPESP